MPKPKKRRKNSLTEIIMVRVTKEQWDVLQGLAKHYSGGLIGRYIRKAALSYRPSKNDLTDSK